MPLDNAERQRRYRARWGSSRGAKPFIGVDGEGCGEDHAGRQNYVLLRAGDNELFRHGRRLTTEECLEFLLEQPEHAIYVGYFFTYDATMILRDIPPDRLPELFWTKEQREAAGRKSDYLFFGDYAIEFRPRQYFRVARLDKNMRVIPNSCRTVNETGGFFQKSFIEALKDRNVGDAKTVAMIAENKERRDEFTEIGARERRYCAAECRLLAEMMEGLRDDCVEHGIAPASWRGAGHIAARLHQIHKTPKKQQEHYSAALLKKANDAYYGGRFEITTVGRIPGPIYQYDINSAYPSAMLKLPCPRHTVWRKFHGAPPASLALSQFVANVYFRHQQNATLAGFPVREKGRLYWPAEAQGTYWSPEIAASLVAGAECHIGQGYVAEHRCDCAAYDWVSELYALRKSLGKATAGYPLKLGLNALYGKLAQREGAAPYRDPLMAGLITAIVRAQIIDAYASDPEAIVMIATDAVFSRRPLPLATGGQLGQWEETIRPDGIFIVQPGIYWSPGSDALPKTRGIPRSKIIAERGRFEAAWSRWLEGRGGEEPPTVTLGCACERRCRPGCDKAFSNFVGHRMALHRGKPQLAGRWLPGQRAIKFDWRGKRQCGGVGYLDGWLTSLPHAGGPGLKSQPYDPKLLTELSDQLLEDEGAPDFQPWGNSGE